MEQKNHEYYMQKALQQAQQAYNQDEVPIGAVIVNEAGEVIAQAHNQMEQLKCQIGHAEMLAIQGACKKINDWRLDGYTLYVTVEPCTMCFGLAQLSRIQRIVYGCRSPHFGFESNKTISLPFTDLIIQGNILESECTEILQAFFERVRKNAKG